MRVVETLSWHEVVYTDEDGVKHVDRIRYIMALEHEPSFWEIWKDRLAGIVLALLSLISLMALIIVFYWLMNG